MYVVQENVFKSFGAAVIHKFKNHIKSHKNLFYKNLLIFVRINYYSQKSFRDYLHGPLFQVNMWYNVIHPMEVWVMYFLTNAIGDMGVIINQLDTSTL